MTGKGQGKGRTNRKGTWEGRGSYSMFLLSLSRFYYRSIIGLFISLYRIILFGVGGRGRRRAVPLALVILYIVNVCCGTESSFVGLLEPYCPRNRVVIGLRQSEYFY